VLLRAARGLPGGTLPAWLRRDLAECVLLDKQLAAPPGAANGHGEKRGGELQRAVALQNALDRLPGLSAEERRTVSEALLNAKAEETKKEETKKELTKEEEAEPPVGTGRFGLGALELEPLDDDQAEDGVEAEAGWGALKALVEEESDEGTCEDDEDEEEEEEEEEEECEEDDEEPPQNQSKGKGTDQGKAQVKPRIAAKKEKEDEEDDEESEGEEGSDENGAEDALDASDAMSDGLESYGGSGLRHGGC